MARHCTVCRHPNRDKIEQAHINGISYRVISSQYGVSRQAIQRHIANGHIDKNLVKANEAEIVGNADNIMEKLKRLEEKGHSILKKAENVNSFSMALQAINQIRQILELYARLTKQLEEGININIIHHPQWITVKTIFLDAVKPYPEVISDIISKLEEINAN